jgi:hypothetical protein
MLEGHDDSPVSDTKPKSGWLDICEPSNIAYVEHRKITNCFVDTFAFRPLCPLEILSCAPRPENFATHE